MRSTLKMNKSKMALSLVTGSVCLLSGIATAQPIVDGKDIDAANYGAALWVNTTNPTQFGDNNFPGIGDANGSEIDAIYAKVMDDVFGDPTLYIGITGNLETNFNKLDIFFDFNAGTGQNKLRGDNIDIDFNGLNRMGDDGSGNGMMFDSAFSANAFYTMTNGNYDCDVDLAEIFANFANLDEQTGGYLGMGTNGFGGLSGGDNPFGIAATINNSNVDGVTDSDTAGSDLVTTGYEISIPLVAFGSPGQDIRLCVFVANSGHDYLSNQISGGAPDEPLQNLGEPRELDMNLLTGNQYVTVDNGGGPSDCLALAVTNLVGGEKATFEITQGTPGAKGVTVYGFQTGSTKVVGYADYCADFGIKGVSQNRVIGGLNKSFDGSGLISFTLPIPASQQGKTVLFQSAERGTCPDECMSNLVTEVIQ